MKPEQYIPIEEIISSGELSPDIEAMFSKDSNFRRGNALFSLVSANNKKMTVTVKLIGVFLPKPDVVE